MRWLELFPTQISCHRLLVTLFSGPMSEDSQDRKTSPLVSVQCFLISGINSNFTLLCKRIPHCCHNTTFYCTWEISQEAFLNSIVYLWFCFRYIPPKIILSPWKTLEPPVVGAGGLHQKAVIHLYFCSFIPEINFNPSMSFSNQILSYICKIWK